MNGKDIINHLDELFARNDVAGAGAFLDEQLKIAQREKDTACELTILNELVGYHRRTNKKDVAIKHIEDALNICESGIFGNGLTVATTYVNCATTYKTYGETEKALPVYEKAKSIYLKTLDKSDYRLAAFYNNYGLTLCDNGDYKDAENCFNNALECLFVTNENKAEIAVTYCNLSFLYDKMGEDEKINICLDRVMENLNSSDIVKDGYYAFNCEKCADAFKYFGRFSDQWELENRAKDIYESNRNK